MVENILNPQKFCLKKNLGSENLLVRIILLVLHIVSEKKFGVKKNVGPEQFWVQNF